MLEEITLLLLLEEWRYESDQWEHDFSQAWSRSVLSFYSI